jgi:hypothetical protein
MSSVGGHSRRRRIRRWPATAVTTLVASSAVIAVVLAGGPGSVTSVRLTSMTSTSGDPAAGTVQAHVTQPQHATVRHAAMTSSAAATGSLSTVLSESVHGGYTAAGIGMRNLGYGTISITGIPAGATVESATLLWDILADSAGPSFAQGTLNGQAFTGTQWASGASPCWPTGANFSYEADVTHLVTGNGSYKLAGFATGQSDGADPWTSGSNPPLDEGASLVVVYQLASMPEVTVQIGEGATETEGGNTASATLDGFTVGANTSAITTYIVADGQEAGNTASFDGTMLPGVSFPGNDPQAVPHYSQGNLWDTVTTDVSSYLGQGDTSATIGVTGNSDCLVWVGQVLSVTASPQYELGLKLWIPQKDVVDPANPVGAVPYAAWRALVALGQEPDLSDPNPAIGPFEAGSTCQDPSLAAAPFTYVSSVLDGDGYSGYGDGTSFRVAATLSFDWNGSSISNLAFTSAAGISHRTIVETTYTLHGTVTRHCVEYHAATVNGSATLQGTSTVSVKLSGVVGFLSSLSRLIGAYPSTSWQIAVKPDGGLSISDKVSEYPSTGVQATISGETEGTDIVNDASCYRSSELLGASGLSFLPVLFHLTTQGSLPEITPGGSPVNKDIRSPGCSLVVP